LIPAWAYLSITTNVVLGITLGLWLFSDRYGKDSLLSSSISHASMVQAEIPMAAQPVHLPADRAQLTYQDWVKLLEKEANATAKKKPDRLMILAGDSISLWFPPDLLPGDRTWLNQAISGETTIGLLRRLSLFEHTEPQAIFVMIGINDLLKGTDDQEVLRNYEEIITSLKKEHPRARIIVQSILPRAKEKVTVVNAQQVLDLSNERIYQVNRRLAAIAQQQKVAFLDLHPLFTDNEGFLRPELTTDGLHLSQQGYFVWRSALQTFNQLTLEQR
jgi:lysophospholipase L1-like esterase